MRMATPSPSLAPSTNISCVTSWPPRRRGVIIGPQHPGAVWAMMVPPFSTGPSIGAAVKQCIGEAIDDNAALWRAGICVLRAHVVLPIRFLAGDQDVQAPPFSIIIISRSERWS